MAPLDQLAAGYARLKQGSLYQRWAKANPTAAAELDSYEQAVAAGKSQSAPDLSATATGDGLAQLVAGYATSVPPSPPPPPSSGPIFGHCKVINHNDLAYCQKEYAEMAACSGQCPRVDYWQGGAQGVTLPAAKAAGFPHLLLCIGATMRSVPDPATYAALVVKAANENPSAFLEFGNENGINGWTPADCARVWAAAYKALRNAGHTNPVLMGSIAGPERASSGRAGPRQWCRELAAAGAKPGVAFDWANYHCYGDVARQEAGWLNYWTPYNGESCQSILGDPPFAVTEFNVPLGDVGGDENAAAAGLSKWMQTLKGQPQCRLATVYALSDDAGGTTSGYGLSVPAQGWRRRPSFNAFKAQVAV